MIGRGLICCVAAAATALSHGRARAADEPVRLAPASKWLIDYADDSCRLAREFGEGERASLVVIERFQPGDEFRLIVAGDAFHHVRSGRDATLRFGAAEAEQEAAFMEGEWAGAPALIFSGRLRIAPDTVHEQAERNKLIPIERHLFEPAPIGPERESAVAFLSVDASGAPEVVFETGSLGEPFAALRTCMDELLTHWGIDVERHRALSRKAVPIQAEDWFHSSDYPPSLLRKGAQGMVHFRLSVDSEGRASACHIQRSTRPEGFDEAACDVLMRRARFKPALDAAGKPIASYYIASVQFVTE